MTGNWALPVIDLDCCTGCGLCVAHCPPSAVEMIDGNPDIVRPQDCTYCGECETTCPEGAIGLGYEIIWPPDQERCDVSTETQHQTKKE